jgi:pimeloyl-ACP methyl ester carboxylesterase
MFIPPGFVKKSVETSLGRLVYYSAEDSLWTEGLNHNGSVETLLFLHGFGGGASAFEWTKVYPAFASDFKILAPDLLGWGRSDHLPRYYTVGDYDSSLLQFIQQVCERPVHAIASCLSAAYIVRVAVEQPELFLSLILFAPAGLSDFGQDYSGSFFAQLVSTPVIDRFLYHTAIASDWGIRNFLEKRAFARPERVTQEMVNAYLASAEQPLAEYTALSFVRGDLCFDLARSIPKLKVPTTVLWGQQAQFTPPELGKRLAELNSEAILDFRILDDVGLIPQLEQPAVTAGLIRKYLMSLRKHRELHESRFS